MKLTKALLYKLVNEEIRRFSESDQPVTSTDIDSWLKSDDIKNLSDDEKNQEEFSTLMQTQFGDREIPDRELEKIIPRIITLPE